MTRGEIELALFLARQVRDGLARLKMIRDGNPEVYDAEIGKHVDLALAEAKAELG
jgi:hypothetical protein